MINLYNTLTKKIEPLKIDKNREVQIYSCGPTAYNFAHIGNLRSFIIPDILVRLLKSQGYKVKWVMNITDIDDKTIKGALKEFGPSASPKELWQYTQKYCALLKQDLEKVGVDVASINFIPVTTLMAVMQSLIVQLLDKGFAYKAEDGSTYFSIQKYQEKFGDYGNLVGEKFLSGQKIGARVSQDEYEKDSLSDFALWKSHSETEDGQIFWDHEVLGKGRPGWHIECSAVNHFAFGGEPADLHTGGVDLIFPHHTNEIAQSQPIEKFVQSWMHTEHIQIDGKKMSKSLGNFYTLRDIEEKKFEGQDLRYLYLQSHWQTQQNFTWQALEASQAARAKLSSVYAQEKNFPGSEDNFLSKLQDNLNLPEALASIWESKNISSQQAQILGLQFSKINSEISAEDLSPELKQIIDRRAQARDEKNFELSDKLRQKLAELGFEVLDSKNGQKIYKKN